MGHGHGLDVDEPCPRDTSAPACPVNAVLTSEALGCRCGKEALEEKHFRTLRLIRSRTPYVLVCKEQEAIGIVPPSLVK